MEPSSWEFPTWTICAFRQYSSGAEIVGSLINSLICKVSVGGAMESRKLAKPIVNISALLIDKANKLAWKMLF